MEATLNATMADAFPEWLSAVAAPLDVLTVGRTCAVILGLTLVVLAMQKSASSTAPTGLLPAWIPLEGAIITAIVRSDGVAAKILSFLRRFSGSLYGLTGRHQVLYDLPGVERVLAKGQHTVDIDPLSRTILSRVFGCSTRPLEDIDYPALNKEGNSLIEKLFVNEAASVAALQKGNVPAHVSKFVSFTEDPEKLQRWERSAGVRCIRASGRDTVEAVDVDLEKLLRDLGASIAIPLLYGKDFLERNATLLSDFWTFDNQAFPLLIIGIPKWAPIKMLQEGIAGRSRLHDALEGLYRRVDQYQNGEAVDDGADMSDISTVLAGRNELFSRFGLTLRERGEIELGILWGQNANTQPLLFWFIFYIYSTPGLADELRSEIRGCVTLSDDGTTPTAVDYSTLSRGCPLLRSTLLETFRMANEPTSIRFLHQGITIPDGDKKHQVPAGTWITTPHHARQRDPTMYAEPDVFKPDRFLQVDEETGTKTSRYGKLKPWGAGTHICKGRTFAEKEILSLGACILSMWDIQPVEGDWKSPGQVPGTGVVRPSDTVRVAVSRRKS